MALEPQIQKSPMSYLADGFFQIAYVVPDLKKAMSYFNDKMGSPRFFVMEHAPIRDQTYNGHPADIIQNVAFGYAGTMQIEIIEPVSGTSTYSEFLVHSPAGGLHHIGVIIDDFDKACRDLADEGFPVIQTGWFGKDTVFGYADTRRAAGNLTEIVRLDDDAKAMFERIKRQEF